ncbi:MAG: EF-P beta-lysylation protein EpmB [Pseudomonadota bacterium]
MIPRTEASWQRESTLSWQQQLQQAITQADELLAALELPLSLLAGARTASHPFALKVPRAFLSRMQKGNPNDPLLRQVLPIKEELISTDGYNTNPVGEQHHSPGIIQKYHGRVLLMVNGHCAVNCRYCFRRHFPYADNRLSRQQWLGVLKAIESDASITEVILSGGDPLASSDRQLAWLVQQIANITHIQRLRIHTRLPVVIPDRITQSCLEWLSASRLQVVMVLHINHPQEIDKSLKISLSKLKQRGITLLNQAVLLKGVNDSTASLEALSIDLFSAGVLPYYLHLLDPVSGAAHFDLPKEKCLALYRGIQERLPGYLLPKLVQELKGEPSKTLVSAHL